MLSKLESVLPRIIADDPSVIHRHRETRADTFADPTVEVVGPYTVRIVPAKATSAEVWDEKGNSVRRLFELVGYDLPAPIDGLPLFKHADRVVDDQGNNYTVVSPQYVRGKMLQVTLELR